VATVPTAVTELFVDGAWVDITDDVRDAEGFTITRGRADERARVGPSRLNLTLENADGRYSRRNPSSPYFGLLGRNTPIRMTLAGYLPYLRLMGGASGANPDDGGYAVTPDAAALDLTGDLDVRIDVEPEGWRREGLTPLIMKADVTEDEWSWIFAINADGTLQFRWSDDGTQVDASSHIRTSTAAVPATSGRLTLRVTLDVNNGAAGHTVTFYTGTAGVGGAFTQLGAAVVTAGTTSVFASASRLMIGALDNGTTSTVFTGGSRYGGRVYGAELRNGIGGSAVANPDFTGQDLDVTGFTDAAGRVWSLEDQAHIGSDGPRFHGEVAEWPVRWPLDEGNVRAPIEANGIMRRLGNVGRPVASPLYRWVTSAGFLTDIYPLSVVAAYYPMEDDDGATSPGAAVGGSATAADVSFGDDADLPASAAVMTFTEDTSTFSAGVPAHVSNGGVGVVVLFKLDATPGAESVFLRLDTDGTTYVELAITTTPEIRLTARSVATGAVLGTDTFSVGIGAVTDWHALHLRLEETVGGTIDWRVYRHLPGDVLVSFDAGSYSGSLGRATRVTIPPSAGLNGASFAHLVVTSGTVNFTGLDMGAAVRSHAGETAQERMVRLCREAGVTFRAFRAGLPADQTIEMGAQRAGTLLELLHDAADADAGILYEPRDWLGLAYRSRAHLENQGRASITPTIGYAQISGELVPVDDDQLIANDVTVSRDGGGSARAVQTAGPLNVNDPATDPDGVGAYEQKITIRNGLDDDLPGLAAWHLMRGTWDEARYPSITVNGRADEVSDDELVGLLRLDVGDRFTLSGLPAWLPPDDVVQAAQGFTETLSTFTQQLVIAAAPGGPYDVGVWNDDDAAGVEASRFDSEYTTLDADYDAGSDTSLTVDIEAGRSLWSTVAGDAPFDVDIAGARVHVTAVAGASSPQTFTVSAATVNGVTKTIPAGTPVRLWKAARYAL